MKIRLIENETKAEFTLDNGNVLVRNAYYRQRTNRWIASLDGVQFSIFRDECGGFLTEKTDEEVHIANSVIVDFDSSIQHLEHFTIRNCVEMDIPVYLYGPAGSGKNYTLQVIADQLNLPFYFTNAVQEIYNLTGFIDANGIYHETEFYKAFSGGGMFFLDEMDASIPDVLVKLNAAIANRYFDFPNGKIEAHKDFRVVAAGNTIGSGSNEKYTGRQVIDSASLDRFVAIPFDYDRNVELMLANGNEDLVNFIHGLRDFADTHGIRATFSYRAIIGITKLEQTSMPLTKILDIAVFKGLEKSTIATMVPDSARNRYDLAMKRMVM